MNGCKGRGALSDATKQVSAQNSRTFGLFAKTNALPHELAAWGDRSRLWHDQYQPQTPASMHLTNECARATLLCDRCADYRDSVIEEQTATERKSWYQQQKRKASRLNRELDDERCEATVEELQTFGEGVRLMIRGFRELIVLVQSNGFLTTHQVQVGIRLYGVAPTPQNIAVHLVGYLVNLYNLGCTPGVSPGVIETWLKPANRPDVLQDWENDEIIDDDVQANRDALGRGIRT